MKTSNKARKLPQICAALSATLGAFAMGTAIAWTAPVLPHILKDQCGHTCDLSDVTAEEGSWIGGLLPFGAVLAGPITGYFLDNIGRRLTMILSGIPLTVGFGLFPLAYHFDSVLLIYIGRVMTGIAGCSFCFSAPLYIVKTCEPSMRGSLSSLMSLMSVFGVALTNALSIGDTVHWQNISLICMIVPVIMMICMYYMPETPCYLLSKGQKSEVLSSLKFLRGSHYNNEKEMSLLQEQKFLQESLGRVSFKAFLTTDFYIKPMLLVTMLMVLQQLSGVNAIQFYSQTMFTDAGSSMDPGLSATLLAITMVIFVGVATILVDKFGRKILLLLSSFFMTVSLFALGVYFYIKENMSDDCLQGKDQLENNAMTGVNITHVKTQCVPKDGVFSSELVDSISWFPLASLICYMAAFSIGVGPLPWTVSAEIFSPEVKTQASSLGYSVNWLSCLLVTKTYANLEQLINTSGAFFLFSFCCAAGVVLILMFLPETKGKLPHELKREFSKKDGTFEN